MVPFSSKLARQGELMGVKATAPTQRLVVIGGDGAGMTAASQARRAAPRMRITVFEKGAFVSYAA
jgi:succinate dehydrogenase/fumarate reductase flavoprotein subunit